LIPDILTADTLELIPDTLELTPVIWERKTDILVLMADIQEEGVSNSVTNKLLC
jgi:hypothetical protein